MSIPGGVRDGIYLKIEGWDIPGNDVANYTKYGGDVNHLKSLFTKNSTSAFYAFNSGGWIKSLTSVDRSVFRQDAGSTLYIRVEYPGWMFYPGQDHPGDDMYQVEDANTPPSMIPEIDAKTASNPTGDIVAAFNTNGYVKAAIRYPLSGQPDPTSLHGIYVRTDFDGFNYFPRYDSSGNDIIDATDDARDVPAIMRRCIAAEDQQAYGFNTSGWIKNQIKNLVLVPSFDDSQGVYVRTEWKDFVYLPGVDSPGHNIRQITGNVAKLVLEARNDNRVVAFNTDGWMKGAFADEPDAVRLTMESTREAFPFGLHVRVPTDLESTSPEDADIGQLRAVLFALQGSVAIWGFYMLPDGVARQLYSEAVREACKEMLEEAARYPERIGQIVERAFAMRQLELVTTRQRGSVLAYVFATAMKPPDLKITYFLDKVAKRLFKADYLSLTELQRRDVMIEIIKSSGRANKWVTRAMYGAGLIGTAALLASVSYTLISVCWAPDWQAELIYQLKSWSYAIALRVFSERLGRLHSVPGAILGGIAGTLVAETYPALRDWFFGGSSRSSGLEILGIAFEATRDAALEQMSASGKQNHIHGVYESQFSALRSHSTTVEEAAKSMIASVSGSPQTGDTLLATIVWTSQPARAYNPGNPQDFLDLIRTVQTTLPADGC